MPAVFFPRGGEVLKGSLGVAVLMRASNPVTFPVLNRVRVNFAHIFQYFVSLLIVTSTVN